MAPLDSPEPVGGVDDEFDCGKGGKLEEGPEGLVDKGLDPLENPDPVGPIVVLEFPRG